MDWGTGPEQEGRWKGSYSVDESRLTNHLLFSSAVASGYASTTDESANSDALSNPVLTDESHSVTATLLRTKALPLPQSPQTTLQPVSAPAAFGHSST